MENASYACFNVTIENRIAHIQLSRPDAFNSMTKDFWNELPDIVHQIDRDALARVIVISSTGKHFSSGMDLSVFADPSSLGNETGDQYVQAERLRSIVKGLQSSFSALEDIRIPVLIAIQGGVIGGAIDMITAGDIRWCTKDAFFTIQETNIAMTADVGTFPRLQRLIPEGWVRQMAYTGMKLDAAKALEIGLVNDVFDSQEQLLEHVFSIAGEIANKDPLTITGCKNIINYGRDHSTKDTLEYISVWNAAMLPPPRMMEAISSKAQKKEPKFSDLLPLRKTPM